MPWILGIQGGLIFQAKGNPVGIDLLRFGFLSKDCDIPFTIIPSNAVGLSASIFSKLASSEYGFSESSAEISQTGSDLGNGYLE